VHIAPRRDGLDLRERVLDIALGEPLVKEVNDVAVYEQDGTASVSLHLKFPAELDLASALVVAERVQSRIRARPRVSDVQTHLEPLEQPLVARAPHDGEDEQDRQAIERLVEQQTGSKPTRTRLLCTNRGRIVFVTLAVEPGSSLTDAHGLASRLEEDLRGRLADIADVVVHTAEGGESDDRAGQRQAS
jgi:divalent metal cation (Fe/Co/Zn/Cd) transporter